MRHLKQSVTLLTALLMVVVYGKAQGLSDWFSQKKSEKQNLIKQVALLQTYSGFLKKGYDIAQDGLHLIGDLKDGDFNLHKGYFSSLSTVSEKVKSYDKVAQIRRYHDDIVLSRKHNMDVLQRGIPAGSDFLSYTQRVYDNLVTLCNAQVAALDLLLSDGAYQMKEDERIHRIDAIYDYMQDKFQFCQVFSAENNAYLVQLLQERSGLISTGKIYDIE